VDFFVSTACFIAVQRDKQAKSVDIYYTVAWWYRVHMNKQQYDFPIIIEADEHGFFAVCPDLRGCFSQGETHAEVLANIEDAIRLHLEDRTEDDEQIRTPRSVMFSTVRISV
jgi:predicted RNase H-like HicB family nuclease